MNKATALGFRRRWAWRLAVMAWWAAGTAMALCVVPSLSDAQALEALPAVAPVMPCAALRGLDLSETEGAPATITDAREVGAETAAPYCRISGYVSPQVYFEVRLPMKTWTQRVLQTGCGGLCGNLRINVERAEGCTPANNGELVLAASDMGHRAPDGLWGRLDPQLRIDFGYRGVHVTNVIARVLVGRFYGRPPKYVYFSGCSDGGREALMAAQRYPGDFNGIAAGAPALNFMVQNSFYHAWNALRNTDSQGRAILTEAELPVLHRAALEACDALDGVKDGLISNPLRCKFDPAVVQCRAAATPPACLSAEQVRVARDLYAAAHDAKGGKLVVGGPQPGSELAWGGVYVPRDTTSPNFSREIAQSSVRNLYYWDPMPAGWNLPDLKFDEETLQSFRPLHAIYDATDPDLRRFTTQGGKLLVWHGWSDPHISPMNSIAYYTAVQKTLGTRAASESVRLFLFPGLYHCGGGDGLFEFDILTPLMRWVESGTAPDAIVASHAPLKDERPSGATPGRAGGPPDGPPPPPTFGAPDRVRAVYPYPATTRYSGSGSIDAAASFVKGGDEPATGAQLDWLGREFLTAGYEQDCSWVGKAFVCHAAH